jgi:hypothetical protein
LAINWESTLQHIKEKVDKLETATDTLVRDLEELVDKETDQFPVADDDLNELLQEARKVRSSAGEMWHIAYNLAQGKTTSGELIFSEPTSEHLFLEKGDDKEWSTVERIDTSRSDYKACDKCGAVSRFGVKTCPICSSKSFRRVDDADIENLYSIYGKGELKVMEPDHERILNSIKISLDKLKTINPQLYQSTEKKLAEIQIALYEWLSKNVKLSEPSQHEIVFEEPAICFSECPVIPEAAEMIARSSTYMSEKKPTDTNEAEVASIGHNYTFHTHPRGTRQPSDADISTTKGLGKKYLCIGTVPDKKVICWDMETGGISCEHPA